MPKYSKEQFLELYKSLPQELKQVFDNEKTMDVLEDASIKYDLSNEQAEQLVDAVGEVIMGLLPPAEFKQRLKDAGIKKDVIEKINLNVYRFIFYPARESLAELYQAQIEIPQGYVPQEDSVGQSAKGPKRKDAYREPIE